MNWLRIIVLALVASNLSGVLQDAESQVPPSLSDIAIYAGLHHAAYVGDVTAIRQLVGDGAALETRDSAGRTALHLAAFQSHDVAVATLAKAGANVDAFEDQDYDIISIAAVADDVEMVRLALALGGNPGNVTSPYDGTALIAAAHLGHHEVVRALVEAGAPLDHVNNLGWPALIEAVILGDGGPQHIETVRILLAGGADILIADRQGRTPLQHAEVRDYKEIAELIRVAGR